MASPPTIERGPGRRLPRPAIRWMAGRWVRRRIVAVVPLAAVAAVGTGAAVVALSAADHTARAYRQHLERAEVGDVLVNTSLNTSDVDEVVRALPGVAQVTSDVMMAVTFDEVEGPLDRAQEQGFVRGSTDGRFVEMDRPVVVEGRMPTGDHEVVVSPDVVEGRGVGLGDVVPVTFWPAAADFQTGLAEVDGAIGSAGPLGTEHLEVVGVVTFADAVLPDDLHPREALLVSPAVTARYDCLPEPAPPGPATWRPTGRCSRPAARWPTATTRWPWRTAPPARPGWWTSSWRPPRRCLATSPTSATSTSWPPSPPTTSWSPPRRPGSAPAWSTRCGPP